jgi:hypothetical protein
MQRNWLAFWSMLTVLAIAALIIPIVYNLRLQLTQEQLDTARQRWREHGLSNYELRQLIRYAGEMLGEELRVTVRAGKVVQVIQNDQQLLPTDAIGMVVGPLVDLMPTRDFSSQTVEGLFDQIEQRLRSNAVSSGRRNYATAVFDPRDGHPIRYVHRVSGTKERLEWQIKLIPEP